LLAVDQKGVIKKNENDNNNKAKMEELMPELVELILGQVDCLSLTVVRFVSTAWMRMVSPPPLRQHPRLDGEVLEQQELGEEEESYSKQVAAKGWLGLLQWARANG
jgi:hypothetical protein